MAKHVRLDRYLAAFAVAAGVMSTVRLGGASPLPRLVVVRSAEAADCPDATALALAVEQQMQRPALDPTTEYPSAIAYEVRIARSADGYAATIQAGDLTRDLSDPGSTCAELGEALALTLTILLDNEPSPSPSPPPPPAESLPKPSSPPALPRPTPPKKIPRPAKPVRDMNLGLDVGLGETTGFLLPFSVAVYGNVWFRYQKASFGLGVFTIPSDSVSDTGAGTVVLRLVTGTLHGCGRIIGKPSSVHFSLCGQSFLGAVYGKGEGFAVNRGGTRPWFALGGMFLLEGSLVGRLGWSVRMSIARPVISQRFTGTPIGGVETPVTLFEPSELAGFVGLGLRWTIF